MRSARSTMSSISYEVDHGVGVLNAMLTALDRTATAPGSDLGKEIRSAKSALIAIQKGLEGNASKDEIGERNNNSIQSKLSAANAGLSTTYGPTALHTKSMDEAESGLPALKSKVDAIVGKTIPDLIQKLKVMCTLYTRILRISLTLLS